MSKPITPKRHLPSTIVIGVLLTIAILIASFVFIINIGATLQAMAETVKEGNDTAAGQVTGVVVVGIFGGAMLIGMFFMAVIIVASLATFGLVKSILNFRTSMGAIKVVNIVYIALSSALVLLSLFRTILFLAAGI